MTKGAQQLHPLESLADQITTVQSPVQPAPNARTGTVLSATRTRRPHRDPGFI